MTYISRHDVQRLARAAGWEPIPGAAPSVRREATDAECRLSGQGCGEIHAANWDEAVERDVLDELVEND